MSGDPAYRPRRSVLYMPSSNERALEKAKTLPVDGLILDLEDAVGPDHKVAARENACTAAASGEYGTREVTIRVNGSGTAWHDDDLAAACEAGPDGIVVPKVNSADEVRSLVAAMERHGAPEHTRLWAMVETPEAVLAVGEIASASPRLAVLVHGHQRPRQGARRASRAGPRAAADLPVAGAAGRPAVRCRDPRRGPQRRPDLEGFEAECRQGRDLGFDGKTLIHPGQVEPCNEVFAPSAEEVEEARELLAAWDAGAGAGVVTHRGRMVENLHVEIARTVIATDEAIRNRG